MFFQPVWTKPGGGLLSKIFHKGAHVCMRYHMRVASYIVVPPSPLIFQVQAGARGLRLGPGRAVLLWPGAQPHQNGDACGDGGQGGWTIRLAISAFSYLEKVGLFVVWLARVAVVAFESLFMFNFIPFAVSSTRRPLPSSGASLGTRRRTSGLPSWPAGESWSDCICHSRPIASGHRIGEYQAYVDRRPNNQGGGPPCTNVPTTE